MGKNENRYGQYRQKKTPRHRSAKLRPGSLEDANRFYRCPQCGFTIDTDKVVKGDGVGNVVETPIETMTGIEPNGDELQCVIVMRGPNSFGVLIEQGADSLAQPISYPAKAEVVSGCPMCGTKNW